MTTTAVRRLQLDVLPDVASIGRAVAGRIADLVAERPEAVVGVATGATFESVYAALAFEAAERELDLGGVRWFALDEYVGLPAGHPQSYRSVLDRQLVAPLGLDPAAVHVPDVLGEDLETAALEYEAAIAASGGVDLQLLGIGANGHLAFNEPGTPFCSRTHMATLTVSTRAANERFFEIGELVPDHALTQGLATIRAARALELVAIGTAKAPALHRALDGPYDPRCPASLVQRHPAVRVTTDAAAAALLDG